MAASSTTLEVKGLPKARVAEFVRRAKRFGMTPQGYLRHLVEEDLTVSQAARTRTFEQLLGAGRDVDEAELDRLVETARNKHHRRQTRRR